MKKYFLEAIRRLFFPRRIFRRIYLQKVLKKPHAIIEGDLRKIYEILRRKGWDVDVYSLEHIILSLKSLTDGVVLENYEGEDLTGEKQEGDTRYHCRVWKVGNYYVVECHHEIYPADEYLTRNPIKWTILAIKHLDGPGADYRKGLEYILNEIKGNVKVILVRNLY